MIRDLLTKNRSYRRFSSCNKNQLKDVLIKSIENTRFGHSAHNNQSLKYVITLNSEINNKLFPLIKWASRMKGWDGPCGDEKPSGYIIIFNDENIVNNEFVQWCDAGIASQIITMTIAENNLASCIIGAFNPEEILKIINIKENNNPLLIIAAGAIGEDIQIKDAKENQSTKYYRDENNIHNVPKRGLEEILMNIFD